MSAPSKDTPVRTPRARLDSLKNPRRSTSRINRPAQKTTPTCGNSSCTRSDVVEDDGKLICRSCGFVVSDVQITQELTFGEAANGAAVVQGVYVGANEENARNTGLGPSKLTGGMDSRQVTERNGHHHINNLVAALRLSGTQRDRAYLMWTLAMNQNFIQGRVTKQVAAVCLYIACRHDTECRLMLVDFSDLLEMNVFKLGQIYTSFMEALNLNDRHLNLGIVNPENLIHRFAQDLEFGPDEHKIANEAVQVLKRLDRDWITTGRRPAGVCAAALILAARMNNYRRTVREVVYTAKVCEITINKRLDEFRYTDSSKLTVEEFRHHGGNLGAVHDPPAFYQQFEAKKSHRSKRVRLNETPSVAEDEQEAAATVEPSQPRGEDTDRARRDSATMPPPPPPIDPALLSGESEEHLLALAHAEGADHADADLDSEAESDSVVGQKRKRSGRPKGAKNKPLPKLLESDLNDEATLEDEVESLLQRPDIEEQASAAHQSLLPEKSTLPQTQTAPVRTQEEPAPTQQEMSASHNIPDTEIISESEFLDDPDVMNAVLNDTEKLIKARIWAHENADYLRLQQARKLKHELAISAGTARVPKKRARTRKPRIGDTAHYPAQRDENGNLIGTASPADSVKMMLSSRGYSKKLDYATVEKLYSKRPSGSPSLVGRSPSERATTRGQSELSDQASPSRPPSKLASRSNTTTRATPRVPVAPMRPPTQEEPIVIEDDGVESSDDESDDYYDAEGDTLDQEIVEDEEEAE
jgi:transcription factor IIIB 90 kDa subunit